MSIRNPNVFNFGTVMMARSSKFRRTRMPLLQCDACSAWEETGTLGTRLLGQVAGVMDPLNGKAMSVSEANDSAALLEGIAPKDAVEGMLAIQMITAHSAAMRFLRIASRSGQSPQVVEVNTNQAIKLMRTFTAQVEALNKYRSKGRQTMTVEHVHVHEGGQAIVGNVSRGGGEGAQP